ncbi:MAG: Asp-tRNA(Asn)/Glu-tRNA(Gln) amidotransferase subunit GatB, partial [Anaerolineaceae bacterium]|nr:Asp-tRNA(Asn)/Glu-tRNA(Gln) amidotransferase subunit GatB [Anaerolineaceae bacterium]
PVCAGMPGSLPVVNDQAVAFGLRVALALDCEINEVSQFARKNYFYPDLPKGYQISQYEYPLAEHGLLPVRTEAGWLDIRIRRVHLEEDTGKLTHVRTDNSAYSLVDLNRAGIPLLEIVSEPDMHSIEQVLAYTRALRMVLQYLGVNSGDLEKGVIRFEANVSVRPEGSEILGTRVEIKNLNSFRTMTAAIAYELDRQTALLDKGGKVNQETLGWDEVNEVTVSQRSKEEAHDYRYFPEPDLPPLVISHDEIEAARSVLPERPDRKFVRFMADLGLDAYQAEILTTDRITAEFYEETVNAMTQPNAGLAANWVSGELFGILNANGAVLESLPIISTALAGLLDLLQEGKVNNATAKIVLEKMVATGQSALAIIEAEGLAQISDRDVIAEVVRRVLAEHPDEVQAYREGKVALRQWFFGQVMREMRGKANPGMVQDLLREYL